MDKGGLEGPITNRSALSSASSTAPAPDLRVGRRQFELAHVIPMTTVDEVLPGS